MEQNHKKPRASKLSLSLPLRIAELSSETPANSPADAGTEYAHVWVPWPPVWVPPAVRAWVEELLALGAVVHAVEVSCVHGVTLELLYLESVVDPGGGWLSLRYSRWLWALEAGGAR